MTTEFSVADIQLTLHRYPKQQVSNLQAWDAADEYIVQQLIEQQQAKVETLIINDSFGSLSAALKYHDNDWPVTIETDARTSQLGCLANFEANQLDSTSLRWTHSRDDIPNNIQLVIMKLPKNLNYFGHQLKRLSQLLPAGTPVLIGAKAKSINKALMTSIAQQLGEASASLAYKKTRIITCIADGQARSLPQPVNWPVPELGLKISNLSNVFAANKLDIGARIMLDNLPQGQFNTVIDLGCGNGILGLRAAQLYKDADIHFVDDSDMAIASAQANWQVNIADAEPNATRRGHFHWDDCLTHLNEQVRPDLILCNPPFHQGEAITDHIAWQMFNQSYQALADNGILHIVGNRHLNYHIKLKRIFGNCHTVASNGKFVILQAKK
ncbi:methyltransferase [Shewanella waksmanii]|uniref:methyltransferase n=1 Tax=Shewanella waksmanii TaxID=213783 RepID=UPI00048A85C8|nr:methyltransferase [Shewanella waksmanii]